MIGPPPGMRVWLAAGPTDMRALLVEALAERDDALAARDALEAQNDRLRYILLKLQRHQFGRKSARLPEEQLELGLADRQRPPSTALRRVVLFG